VDALGLHLPGEVGQVAAVGLDRVARQERIADPGDQRPGGGGGLGARGVEGAGQEGLDLVGGRSVALEGVAPPGDERGAGPGIAALRGVRSPYLLSYRKKPEDIKVYYRTHTKNRCGWPPE